MSKHDEVAESARLEQIEARRKNHDACAAEVCRSRVCQTARDRDYLLALVREQAAKLDEYEAKHGEHTTDNQGRGCPACAAHIRVQARERAALTAKEVTA